MKNILITGANSYIGMFFENRLKNESNYIIDTIDMIGDSWKKESFSKYDVIFHVAGLVHIKENKNNKDLYFAVNRDLTYEIAKKAKIEGVKQFVFLSTMSVYGIENGIINEETIPNPKSNYGKSKLQAEQLITSLKEKSFNVTIIRPPMVYGKNCKGNYQRLSKLATKLPIFPCIKNQRSMIYIGNLIEFVKNIIDDNSYGIFFPQDSEYVSTSEMVRNIARINNHRIHLTKVFNSLIRLFNVSIINKMFGTLIYDKKMSTYKKEYQKYSFDKAIELTESH